MGPEKGN